MAWLGALGSLGLTSWVSGLWGAPLAIGLLVLTDSALVLRARRSLDWGPVLMGLLGSGALLAGKLLLDAPLLLYAGLGLLVAASILSNRLVARLLRAHPEEALRLGVVADDRPHRMIRTS
jgi:hypothetical protein